MTLYLIRHGQTALNVARVLQPPHTGLSEAGHAQAAALAERLREAALVGVVSSDLPRAVHTAQAIASACGLRVESSALLRERDFGDLRGRPYDSLGFDPLAMHEAPSGGESMDAFIARCSTAWTWVLGQRSLAGGALAVVTHGLVLRAWFSAGAINLGGLELPAAWPNAALGIVGARPPHRVQLLACTAHLGAAAAGASQALHGG